MDLHRFIRDVPDFPKPGIVFKDITPLLADGRALRYAITSMANQVASHDFTKVAGIESRGFMFGIALAREFGLGFIPIRKAGKLPWRTTKVEYVLEYGSDSVEMHQDAIRPGDRVLVVDDLLATGGTLEAAVRLVENIGGVVAACSVVIELGGLGGRKRLPDKDLKVLLHYD
jgi:adenine phosphoribosyltransferase